MGQTLRSPSFLRDSKLSPLFFEESPPKKGWKKRIFDICFSTLILILIAPFFLLISLAIKLSSKGPILFRARRITIGGKPFYLWKFRTMVPNAEKVLEELLERDASSKKEYETFRKLKNDPRITPIGRFLRKTSLDELPQFFNVLKGDISVVGPRAAMEEELIEYYKDKAKIVLSVLPGVTGPWQVKGRNHLSIQERVDLEVSYVQKQSFLYDLQLIIQTIPAVFFSKGAY